MTVAHTFLVDTRYIVMFIVATAMTIGERRGAAAVACTWLVCLAALYWRGV